jgi:antitoxin YefM
MGFVPLLILLGLHTVQISAILAQHIEHVMSSNMRIVTYTEARNNLRAVFDTAIDDADVTIVTRRDGHNAVVMGQDYYNSLIETLHLLSTPSNAAHLAKSIAEYRSHSAIRRELDNAE